VCVQRGDTLQLGPSRTVDELPRSIKGCAGSRITGVGVLERRENFLSGLCHIACYDSQLVHGQLEVTGHGRRHGIKLLTGIPSDRQSCSLKTAVSEPDRPEEPLEVCPVPELAR
jgi:hypothetical protein